MAETRDLLFELGTEELPPKSLLTLSRSLTAGIVAGLDKAGLGHGEVKSYATPRRLAVLVSALQTAQPDQTVERRGPAKNAAYQADGSLSKAAEGFLRSCNATAADLITLSTDKGEWLCVRQQVKGAPTASLVPDIIRQSLAGLPIAKRMRWGAGTAEFVRPAHWVVLLFGEEVIDTEILGIATGRISRGHRFHGVGTLSVANPSGYAAALREQGYVIADFEERKQQIRTSAERAAGTVGGIAHIEPDLLDEVASLVEWPVPVLGGFEERFSVLPGEVLITTMQENQKYFPVKNTAGQLLPHFITFSNVDSSRPDTVRQGNERVVRPRLADAEFFWNQDRKQTLEARVPKLADITFQKTLGSLLDKTRRVQFMASAIAERLNVAPAWAERAALLAKADLLTEIVGEFTNLQGTMGRYYASAEGEPDQIAAAIEEQYLPKVSGGPLPQTQTGRILALAEKLDTLVGIFSAGLLPTGDKDPYALRRAALGAIRLIVELELDLDLMELLDLAAGKLSHEFARTATVKAVFDFIVERFRGYSLDRGYQHDEFDAVLAVNPTRLIDFEQRLKAVQNFRALPEAESLAAANKRIRNILRKAEEEFVAMVDDAGLKEPEEKALLAAVRQAEEEVLPLLHRQDYQAALSRLAGLRNTVDAFFDKVMVMCEDATLRSNRLGLLAIV
ncbi:MAG: glycine--tRNA ligase subunit beta, partial [Methylococcaceae bacterium]|nr:glycine--tRNA ligase subunit beta [Methylococcaceae bacterium]